EPRDLSAHAYAGDVRLTSPADLAKLGGLSPRQHRKIRAGEPRERGGATGTRGSHGNAGEAPVRRERCAELTGLSAHQRTKAIWSGDVVGPVGTMESQRRR